MTTLHLCPACGASNQCSLASTQTVHQPCWCYSVSIDPQVLHALPLEQQDLACLCPRCANVLSQLPPTQTEHLA